MIDPDDRALARATVRALKGLHDRVSPELADALQSAHDELVAALNEIPTHQPREVERMPREMTRVARSRFRSVSRERRQEMMSDALGERWLTAAEAAEAFKELLPDNLRALDFDYGSARALLHQMMAANLVDREQAEMYRGRRLWRYHRRVELSGPIADLDRMFEGGN